MERIENIGFDNLKLIQDDEGFMFGIDAVILADFAACMHPGMKKAVDLGTGNGIIPLILSHKAPGCTVTGFDIQEKAVDMATRSCDMNNLADRISFHCCDVKNIAAEYPEMKGSVDAVITNPPYVAKGSGIVNDKSSKFIARQETTADIEDFVSAAASLLNYKGHLFMVHRPNRLVDIFYYCRKYNLEPKDIRFVAPSEGRIPNIVLIHSILGGGHELNYLDTLNVYDKEGNYTAEIVKIYEKTG